MKTALDNSAIADAARWLLDFAQWNVWNVRCFFGWHRWKTYNSIFTVYAPLKPTLYEACIHCGYERRGSHRPADS